ncbi:MAG: YHYH protein [Gemmataceae bacterium]|nr:YHYH protein [Gemmataceae bacterium]
MRRFAAVIAIVLLLGSPAWSHPGHDHAPHLRTWKDADGLFVIEASYVLARDDRVQLRKHDGELVWVPLAKLSPADREWIEKRRQDIQLLNEPVGPEKSSDPTVAVFAFLTVVGLMGLAVPLWRRGRAALLVVFALVAGSVSVGLADEGKDVPAARKHFEPFQDKLQLRTDADYLYVGSNGLPDHPMMVGIRSWQQQVPLPQPYTGQNAWRIPLKPVLADKPISAKTALFRGAIALAVNGVPIFNALNNRGDDTFLAGELDEYGGHCGRGDDYHYHIAPVHLQKKAGPGNPIAYALDGFPLYGYTDATGKEPTDLDEFNGRMENGSYRYYSTKKYPYINGGMRGRVTVRGDQIEPQPKDSPLRPAGRPLRGATITAFTRDEKAKTSTLKYDVQGRTHTLRYTDNSDGTWTFTTKDPSGRESTETFRRRDERGQKKGGKDKPGPRDDAPGDDDDPPPGPPPMQIGLLAAGGATSVAGLIHLFRTHGHGLGRSAIILVIGGTLIASALLIAGPPGP